ncbi:MAG: tyrosine--tRNA ligase [Endomicrobium sp.]|jgi:tyrosyl-tRNA synthetase|nr:tyrosine--tRNA ligase [Endomicrobium sp.]
MCKTIEAILHGATEIISIKELKYRLYTNKRLTIKFGVDPTAPDLHLGHVVILNKLRILQNLGHKIIFLIGDFTARIGDPSGRSTTRQMMTEIQIQHNVATYIEQVSKILDITKTEIIYNSNWFKKLSINDILKLATTTTVSKMLKRTDFDTRYKENKSISIVEFLYPLLQAYDSIILKPDIEIGGNDQKFNLLLAREVQRSYGINNIQIIITMPILEGLDGIKKMSKSYNNYISLNDSPKEMFGKIMSISDMLMYKYYTYLTDFDLCRVRCMHPKDAKSKLAYFLVEQYYGKNIAYEANQSFHQIFVNKEYPNDMQTVQLSNTNFQLSTLLLNSKLCKSKNEAKRLIKQGGVKINSCKIIKDSTINTQNDFVLQVGKKRFKKVVFV